MVSKVVKKHGKNDGTKKEKRTNRIMHGIGKAIGKASKFLAVGIFVAEISGCAGGKTPIINNTKDVQEISNFEFPNGSKDVLSELNSYIDSDSSAYTTSVKEAVLYVNDSNHQKYLEMDGYHFVLDDVQAEDTNQNSDAIITVTDADGNPVSPDYTRMSIAPGTTKEVTINGKIYKIHVLNTTRGFTSMSATARISVSSQNTES